MQREREIKKQENAKKRFECQFHNTLKNFNERWCVSIKLRKTQ